jgi:hypothetical protein
LRLSHKSNRRLRRQIKFYRAAKNQKIASDFLIFCRSERISFGGVSRHLTYETASIQVSLQSVIVRIFNRYQKFYLPPTLSRTGGREGGRKELLEVLLH